MEKFNIVIGTHGRFGEELVNSARMIAGALENVQCCSLLPEYSFEDYMKLADETMCTKEGFTIVLVDLYGGTPCNVFTVMSRKYHYPVLTGLNLPMLIDLYLKLSNMDEADLDEEALLRKRWKLCKPAVFIRIHSWNPEQSCLDKPCHMNYNFHESTIMQKGIYYSGLPCGTIGIQGRCQTS